MRFIQGNCLDKITELEDNSIDCVVSSPPYFGLRDYGTAQWQGGDPNCEHTITHYNDNLKPHVNRPFRGDRSVCIKCSAKRIDLQFGLENTYLEYIANTVKVFETFKPKLKETATIWWNVGDSYSSGSRKTTTLQTVRKPKSNEISESKQKYLDGLIVRPPIQEGIKEKDLMMIPNRVAIALQEAGWYIRSEIIWHKPNPMPESVRDRPTSCHEKIWLITKNKKYYYDAESIKEPTKTKPAKRDKMGEGYQADYTKGKRFSEGERVWGSLLKNKRNVWTVTTKPFKAAHFATFPPDLIEPCIKAGCPEGGIVLDPFAGSGTTGLVAKENNRDAILIELNGEYLAMAKKRIEEVLI
jgi:DNA modification methylase